MQNKNLVWMTTLLLVLAVVLTACGQAAPEEPVAPEEPAAPAAPEESAAPEEPAASEDTRGVLLYNAGLDYGGSENLDPVDPARFFPPIALLFDRLTVPTGTKLIPSPSLAKSWEANETNDVWTFHLQENAFFHDGAQVTSADVAYSANYWKTSETSVLASTFGIVDSIETPDDFTVVFNLNRPHVDFPMVTMDYRARILPKDGLPGVLETGIGSGPFKLEKLDVEGVTRLVANDDYWGGAPGLAAIEIYAIADAQASLQALQSGQIDFGTVTLAESELFDGNDAYLVTQIPSGTWHGFVMRTDIEPFDNLALRQAMRLVVDRQAMVDLVLGGAGTVSCDTAVMPGDPYQLTDCPDGGQDIEAAKQKLIEAGYPDGFDITLFSSDMLAEWNPMAEIFQQQAAQAGINVTIENAAADGFYTDTWMVQPFVMTNWNERAADQALNEIYRGGGSWNESYWNVPEFDALLDAAASEPDFDARRQYYIDAQQMLHEDGGTIIPFFQNLIRVQKTCVENVPEMGVFFMEWTSITKSADCK